MDQDLPEVVPDDDTKLSPRRHAITELVTISHSHDFIMHFDILRYSGKYNDC